MQFTRNSLDTVTGPDAWFTGAVYVSDDEYTAAPASD
jgi:hypothetical protein